MKILLITNNLFQKQSEGVFTDKNTYQIIKRFSYLGHVRILGGEYHSAAFIKMENCLSFISETDLIYIKKSRLLPTCNTLRQIKDEVLKCDLVIGYQSPCVNAECALYFAKKYNKKYLSYVVACAWDGYWNHGIAGKLLAPLRFLSLKIVVRLSDYVLYVTTQFLQKRYPNKRITLGCSDVVLSHYDEDVLAKRLNRIEQLETLKSLKLVTVASLDVRYKGQQYVLEALGRLKRSGYTSIHYYLIGIGSKEYLEKIAKQNGVEDLVHIIGSIPHEDVFQYLDDMDVYIQPSLQEGLPRSLVEAMSRGLLCIGTKTAGIPELLDSDYIVSRRSVTDIVEQLLKVSQKSLREQAIRNYDEAKKFVEAELNSKRKLFFDRIREDNI